jgi:hypothetical protein
LPAAPITVPGKNPAAPGGAARGRKGLGWPTVKKVLTNICYLCGKPLAAPTNVDHPVMKQIFAPQIRRQHNVSQLITFDVHKACNSAYQHDEDYFVRTLSRLHAGR